MTHKETPKEQIERWERYVWEQDEKRKLRNNPNNPRSVTNTARNAGRWKSRNKGKG